MRLARDLQNLLQVSIAFCVDRQGDVHVRCAKGIFPVGRCIGTEVVQDFSARRHALPEFDRETVQRCLRQTQSLEALEGEGDSDPAGQRWHPPFLGWADAREDSAKHLPSLPRVAYAENDIRATVRSGTRAQDDCLYVACFDRRLDVACISDGIQNADVVRNHAGRFHKSCADNFPCVFQRCCNQRVGDPRISVRRCLQRRTELSRVCGVPSSGGAADQDRGLLTMTARIRELLRSELGGIVERRRRMTESAAQTHVASPPPHRGTTALPEDLLRDQVIRMQLLYCLEVGLWTIHLVMEQYVSPHGDRGPYTWLIQGVAAATAALVAAFMRFSHVSDRRKLDVGVAMMVPNAFAIAMMN